MVWHTPYWCAKCQAYRVSHYITLIQNDHLHNTKQSVCTLFTRHHNYERDLWKLVTFHHPVGLLYTTQILIAKDIPPACTSFSDINTINDGLGDKICVFVQFFCTFVTGFIIGFVFGWKLTLVILTVSPLLAGSAAVWSKVRQQHTLRPICPS